jgi:hypothetical protein
MATGIGPIRGDLVLVKIEGITKNVYVDGTKTGTTPILVKMKRGVAEFFGETIITTNDAMFTGVFPTINDNLNSGATFRKHLGGRGDASYIFVSAGTLDIKEYYFNDANALVNTTRTLKSFSQGFPRGHSVSELVTWLASKPASVHEKIRAIISPTGKKTDINFV